MKLTTERNDFQAFFILKKLLFDALLIFFFHIFVGIKAQFAKITVWIVEILLNFFIPSNENTDDDTAKCFHWKQPFKKIRLLSTMTNLNKHFYAQKSCDGNEHTIITRFYVPRFF